MKPVSPPSPSSETGRSLTSPPYDREWGVCSAGREGEGGRIWPLLSPERRRKREAFLQGRRNCAGSVSGGEGGRGGERGGEERRADERRGEERRGEGTCLASMYVCTYVVQ